MKKVFLVAICCFSLSMYSQEEKKAYSGKNEIKGNALFMVLGFPEFTYERILSDETAAGVSIAFAADKEFEQRFYLSPYFRYYFGEKPAAGFFVEGFGMLNQYKANSYYYPNNSSTEVYKEDSVTDFAIGFGLGAKWLTKSGFLFELNSGIGRNLLNSDKNDFYGQTIVGKFGLTVGYRF